MFAWLARLIGGSRSGTRSAASAGDATANQKVGDARLGKKPTATGALATPDAASGASAAGGARRPLIGTDGALAGFELRLPAALERRLAERQRHDRSDVSPAGPTAPFAPAAGLAITTHPSRHTQATQATRPAPAAQSPSTADTAHAAHWSALLATARALQHGGPQVLLQMPAAVLSRPGMADQVAPGLLLLPTLPSVPPVQSLAALAPPAPQSLAPPTSSPAVTAPAQDDAWAATRRALRQRGVRIGVSDGPPALAPDADFVLLQASAGGCDTLLLSAQRWQEARPRLMLVALGLESIDDIERVLAAGISLAGGQLTAALPTGGAQPATPRPLQAAAHRICAMLNALALDSGTSAIADAVRADVALSYRLLRYANSPALGQARAVDTVEQALLLLGRSELARWLAVMLLGAAAGRQASPALQAHALARGRLLETLAQRSGAPAPATLFTVGALSRLDLLLDMPLAAALEPLRLSDDVAQALLQRRGPWAPYLALADALESDDEAGFATLCAPFGGLDVVLSDATVAWGWAAQMQASA